MLKAGLAEVYGGKAPKGFDRINYKLTESNAKESGVGIWSQGAEYVSPRDWRKTHK